MAAKTLKKLGMRSKSAWPVGEVSHLHAEIAFRHARWQPNTKPSGIGLKLPLQIWYRVLCTVLLSYYFWEGGGRKDAVLFFTSSLLSCGDASAAFPCPFSPMK